MRFFSRLPLATRLSAIAVLTLLPLAILLVVSHLHDRTQRREAGVAEANAYARNIGNQLEGFARDLDSFTAAAGLLFGSYDEPITQANASTYLRNLKAKYDNISNLFVTDLNGIVVATDSNKDEGFDLRNRPYITALQQGADTYWSGGITGARTGQITAAFARVIYNDDKQPVGYLVAPFRPSAAGSSVDVPKDANIVLIGQNGQALFSLRDPKLENTPANVADNPEVQKALNGEESDVKNQKTPFDSGARYGAYIPIPHMKWALGYTRSQSVLDSELTGRLQRDIAIMAGIIAITVLVLAILARQMIRPIGRLATAAQAIAGGDRVELPASGTDPDVHRLEQAFAAMSKAVAEREERMSDQARVLATLEAVGSRLASDLDFDSTVQSITDAGTRLTQAAFGSFFYKVTNADGQSDYLYALSGIAPEAFAGVPLPSNSAAFASSFSQGVVRIDDITKDAQDFVSSRHFGLPTSHQPVRSYLAAPVFSRNGEVMGGLFFGHPEAGVFTQRHEELAVGIASWAAIALNNASLYQQSQQAQEELRRSNDAKDEFLGVVSHELRTPTTTIYGGIRMLDTRRHLLSQDATAELIHTMSEEADRLVRLIENLLVFARLELGRMPEMEPTSLNQLADAVIETFSRIHPTRALEVAIAEGIPTIFAQPTSIERVMENLLSNADKYSPAGESISLVVEREGEELMVCVRDKGRGVPNEEIELIFDSFYRAQKASQVATGHGLGLSISKRIIDSHEGRIWAKNLPGGGFEVGFALPLIGAVSAADSTNPANTTDAVGAEA